MTALAQTNIKETRTIGLLSDKLEEAKQHYDWVMLEDNTVVAVFPCIVCRGQEGCFTSQFKFKFKPEDVFRGSQAKWPLTDLLDGGDRRRADRLASKVLLNGSSMPGKRIYLGNYDRDALSFTMSDNYKYEMFVTENILSAAGYVFNCDVIMVKGFNAIMIPVGHNVLKD